MKKTLFVLTLATCMLASSCKKDDGGTTTTIPPAPDITDFAFPASGTPSATLYASSTSVVVNQEFDIRFVLYNVTDAFGAAAEITYPADKIQLTADAINQNYFSPPNSTLVVKGVVTAGVYAYGVTYQNGTGLTQSGSGVIMKLRCKATATGTAAFALTKLDIRRADGSAMSLPIQNVSVAIQ